MLLKQRSARPKQLPNCVTSSRLPHTRERPFSLGGLGITQKHHYKTRLAAQQNYFQPKNRTELGKKTFSYIGPKIWQEVPFELKSLSYNQFKKKFKLFLTCQY